MKVLVTGATGFLGSHLAALLVRRGIEVRALVRARSDRRRIDGLPLELAQGDVTDAAAVAQAAAGTELVFHCAALYELGTPDPARMERINVGGTRNVLDAAAAAGAAVVHVSSTVALGPTGPAPADETHWSGGPPRSAYEATKRAAHELARRHAAAGARIRIACPPTIYGPDDPSLVGQFHRAWARGLVGAGSFASRTMSFVHVDDCADGLVRIAERGRDGETYLLAAQVATFREWYDALAAASGRTPVRIWAPDMLLRVLAPLGAALAPLAGFAPATVREGVAMTAHWAYSGERARRELGWTPRPFEEGLRETLAWYSVRPWQPARRQR